MTRRPGLSLTEVLVALFIMALGTISILTLFPLGALKMGEALKDDRTSQAATQADGYMRWYWRNQVVEPTQAKSAGAPDPFTTAFTDPEGNGGATGRKLTAPAPNSPSYPVAVDPMGFVARGDPDRNWITSTNLPRRNLKSVTDQTAASSRYAQRVCSLMDGLSFSATGVPSGTGSQIDRELRYNWLWVLQQPNSSNKTTATMSVVVFDRRAHLYTPNNAEVAVTVIPVAPATKSATPGSTSLTVSSLNGAAIQKGTWVLDATIDPTQDIRHANFYRVVSATTNTSGGLDLELQTPIRRADGKAAEYDVTLVVLAGVVEVFERPSLTAVRPGS